jgi:hypothetical protein
MWFPMTVSPVDGANGVKRGQIFRAVARLKPGVTVQQAASEATARAMAAPDAGQVTRLIADLDSDEFAVRESAHKQLEKLGEPALAALQKALDSDDLETRRLEMRRVHRRFHHEPRAEQTQAPEPGTHREVTRRVDDVDQRHLELGLPR